MPVESIRDGEPPVLVGLGEMSEVGGLVRDAAEAPDFGRIAVIVPASLHSDVERSVVDACPAGMVGHGDDRLDAEISVLTVRQAKGLEFDVVYVVEPDLIDMEGSGTGTDLYVALTRATRQLTVVYSGAPPRSLGSL